VAAKSTTPVNPCRRGRRVSTTTRRCPTTPTRFTDPALITDGRAIILRMGKALRGARRRPLATTLRRRLEHPFSPGCAPATAKGGDLLWLSTAHAGRGWASRTNAASFDQLGEALASPAEQSPSCPSPASLRGAGRAFDLLSLISLVDRDLAVVYRPLLPCRSINYSKRAAWPSSTSSDEGVRHDELERAALTRHAVCCWSKTTRRAGRWKPTGCAVLLSWG
jgi:hypothetical protein